MALVLKSLLAALIGVALGLAATWRAVEDRLAFSPARAGPWIAWPKIGARDSDPYMRAERARDGDTPLGLTEGLAFTATRDSNNVPFDMHCEYEIAGDVPQSRFWTLTATDRSGQLLATRPPRHGLTSSELVRDAHGDFAIEVAARARPGNWLPVSPDNAFQLVLRLYDTAASASAYAIDESQMPTIARGACR